MCYLALFLSLSSYPPTPVHAPSSRPSVIYLLFLSARCGRGTFNSFGHNLTSVARISLRFEGVAAGRGTLCRCGSGAAAPNIKCPAGVSSGCAVALPVSCSPSVKRLSGGSRHSCCWLLIPLLFRGRLQPSGSPLSERLKELLPHFPVTVKVTWLVDIGSLTQKCRLSWSKTVSSRGLKSAVPLFAFGEAKLQVGNI